MSNKKKILNQKPKTETAITLVSLVITIIILLILAGIVLIGILSDKGVIGKAKSSKQNTLEAQAIEDIRVIILEVKTENLGEFTFEKLVEKLEQKPDIYIIRRKSKFAQIQTTEDGKSISNKDGLDGTEKTLYITNTKYDIEVTVYEDSKVQKTPVDVASQPSRLEEKQAEIDRLNKDVEDLTKSLNEKNQAITNLNGQVSQKNQEIANLKNQITSLNSQVAQLQNKKLSVKTFSMSDRNYVSETSVTLSYDVKSLTANWKNLTVQNFGIKSGYIAVTAKAKDYTYRPRRELTYDNTSGILYVKATIIDSSAAKNMCFGEVNIALYE